MAKRSSSSMEVLLGLLTIEPMSGYDLGMVIRGSIGHFWNESYGQIYPNLKKLAAGGFADCKSEKQKGKPDRQIYSITKKGRERLAKWLAVGPQPEIPRNELLLKLFFGTQSSPDVLIAYVEHLASVERVLLRKFKQAVREDIAPNQHYPDAPYWKMVARFGQIEMAAHIRWAEETLEELRKLATMRRGQEKDRREKNRAAN